jgi:SAM-dependent methyltransferase
MDSWKYDAENSEFWNYLCGTNAALGYGFDVTTSVGIEDFDSWYFKFYPYLRNYLEFALSGPESVLEIGLGLGTTSRYLASNVSKYTGLDIAPNVISFLREDFKNRKLHGEFVLGSY